MTLDELIEHLISIHALAGRATLGLKDRGYLQRISIHALAGRATLPACVARFLV